MQGEGEVVSVPHLQEVQCGEVSECIFGRCWEPQEGDMGNGSVRGILAGRLKS